MTNISCADSQNVGSEPKTLLGLALNRRSVRSYTNEKIDHDTLERILKTGLLAPSSYGQDPVELVVVEDRRTLGTVASCKAMGAPSVRNASAAVVVMADTTKGELWVEDCSVVAENIQLAAEAEGVSACWNQIHLRRGLHSNVSDEICDVLGVPRKYKVCRVIAMGYKAEKKRPKTIQDIDTSRIHWENY